MSHSVEKSRHHIRGLLITAVQWERICGVHLGGEDETALYTLSGHIGARTAEVSCKRKPLKAEGFDVAGSNRGLSRCSCGREQFNLVRKKRSKVCPFLPCYLIKSIFVERKAKFCSWRGACRCNGCSVKSIRVVLMTLWDIRQLYRTMTPY